jgi:uncharacterized membrane protein
MQTVLAVLLAIAGAICFNYGGYLMKVAVVKLPQVKLKLKWSVVKAFFSNKPWLIAFGFTLLGSVFYAVAIAMAPVSIIQPIVGAGVALLAYLAIKNLGERPRRQDLIAIGMSILGVILIGISLMQGIPKKAPPYKAAILWLFTGIVVFLAVIIPFLMRGGSGNREAAGLGICVGLLYGMTAIFARLLLVDWTNQWHTKGILVLFSSVFLLAWAAVTVPAVIVLQAALQRGMAIIVMPLVAGLSQVIPIMGGMLALGEKFPTSVALTVVRIIAFCMILVATIILSRRAEETIPGEAGAEESRLTPEEVLS